MGGVHFPGDNGAAEVDVACDGEIDRRNVGKMEHGCEHYRRRCKIVACNQVLPCRHCHNKAMLQDHIGADWREQKCFIPAHIGIRDPRAFPICVLTTASRLPPRGAAAAPPPPPSLPFICGGTGVHGRGRSSGAGARSGGGGGAPSCGRRGF
ncbi:uncharacterized protein LOC120655819 [Panicum virgatum]|uniref:uncharacterized protein LOC120655819 n=1 Tax=Panicum virgatum TaxID=38727 RepID=UPI0019D57BEA|nr:uncharacterized protein LOC120655819 [Panicum virgatum]